MKTIKLLISTALSLSVMLILNACGEQTKMESVLDAVPDSARSIALIDAEKLGAHTDDFLPGEFLTPIKALRNSAGIDTTHIALFTTKKGYSIATLRVTDRAQLAESLGKIATAEDRFDNFDVASVGNRKIIFDDNRCYISPDIQIVKKFTTEKRPDISPIAGIRDFLNNSYEAITSASIASDLYGKKLEGVWLCRSMHFTENSVSVDLSLLKPGGDSGQIGNLLAEPIDPDVLRFIPDRCSLVAATGRQLEGAKLFGIESLLRSYIPVELNISPSGTTAWYGRPAGSLDPDDLLSPRQWNFVSLSQTSQTEGAEMVNGYLTELGGRAQLDPDTDIYSAEYSGMTFSFGYYQGYSVMGINGEFTPNNSNSYTTDFQDARMVVIVDIPKDSPLQQAAQLPCGASLTVKATTDNLHGKLRFFGNTDSPLSTVDSIPVLHNILPFLLNLE